MKTLLFIVWFLIAGAAPAHVRDAFAVQAANDWLTSDVYDANGNTRTNGANVFFYDAENRLTNAVVGGVGVTIIYDGDGNRVRKIVGTTTNTYLVCRQNLTGYAQVLEERVNGALTRVYTYGLDLISQRDVPLGATLYFGYDGLGSTRYLTTTNATVANAFAYDAFGTVIASNAAPQTDYLFTGEQRDPNLGFYYLRARYLNPGTGRFWTRDTHPGNNQDPLSLHRYLYAHADPVNRVDPSGQMSFGEISSVMTKIGYLSGRTFAALSNARWTAYARLTSIVEKGWQAIFWTDVGLTTLGVAAAVAPEVLNVAASLSEKINRAYSMNTVEIPQGWGARGITIENIGGQQLEAIGGNYVGGNVKGIDGTIGGGRRGRQKLFLDARGWRQ